MVACGGVSGLLAIQGAAQSLAPPTSGELSATATIRHGRELLTAKRYAEAQTVFLRELRKDPGSVQAQLGLGDAQLGLHAFEAAEATYRRVTAQQPQLWQAHKNLVIVEAALGRWEDFDRERTVLRMARERNAPGISRRESDVIDVFHAGDRQWVVRAYFEPLGRSAARYNFERFSPAGRVEAYLSLEDAEAARAALEPQDERLSAGAPELRNNSEGRRFTLNWYTGTAHGQIKSYSDGEPRYPQLRADAIGWIRAHAQVEGASQGVSH